MIASPKKVNQRVRAIVIHELIIEETRMKENIAIGKNEVAELFYYKLASICFLSTQTNKYILVVKC